ncbi:hypothetical protein D9758_009153 [Tetrapyrgos nigripes]|uniref:Sucrase/ferredoxin-like-domain-containing protein n=1 Tax=Tetrapyrgos nigripes TaxID=182062 RepID=A0A8H5LK94_9AGAR|nr:hypothetical protein D9758_009153 [Tetrapyrgos nigripes]
MTWSLLRPSLSFTGALRSRSLVQCTRTFSTTPSDSKSSIIAGTAPSYRCYIFLHSSVSPASPSFSARLMTPLQRALQMKVLQWGGFVNWAYYEDDLDGRYVRVDPTSVSTSDAIKHSATAFTSLGERIEIPSVSLDNVDEVTEYLRRRVEGSETGTLELERGQEETHLLVCTHMSRDCRCGEKGGDFVDALKEELAKRRRASGVDDMIRVGETAHVGGHKHAANLLLYPQGDWFGNLTAQDVPQVLDYICEVSASSSSSSSSSSSTPNPSLDLLRKSTMKDHWRGRMSLSKTEQLELYNSW